MSDDDKDGVGYCRPPKKHRFRSGKSGNPRGRPKKRENRAHIIDKVLDQLIEANVSGKERKVSVYEAFTLTIVKRALAGSNPAARILIDLVKLSDQRNRIGKGGSDPYDFKPVTEDARAMLTEKIQRLAAQMEADENEDKEGKNDTG